MIRSIAKIAIPSPLPTLFDYLYEGAMPLCLGARVTVPFGRRLLVGFVMQLQAHSELPAEKLKTILTVLDEHPFLDAHQRTFLSWAAAYYHHPIGQVVISSVPRSYRAGKALVPRPEPLPPLQIKSPQHELNADQTLAFTWIQTQLQSPTPSFACALLEGVTGSGKTAVYLEAIAQVLKKGKQTLLLIPEIALCPQTIERLQACFGDRVLLFHSQITEKKRQALWWHARHSAPLVVIGTRSALFLPFFQLGLIIVDEEHESHYKQSEGFHYQGRDCAVYLAHHWQIPIVLGTATPSLATLHNQGQGRYTHLLLPERAGSATLPILTLIDDETRLYRAIERHLKAQHQVLLFLNRRGFSPTLLCPQCQWSAQCQRCQARMTVHQRLKKLWCHHCDGQMPYPSTCPQCQTPDLLPIGVGTERLEETIQTRFPTTRVIRIDSDSIRLKNTLEEKLAQIHTGEPAIIMGTQMIAKGHHFSKVTLVGILDVDSGLLSADYSATERMGQLITQVAGRAGRGEHAGEVLLLTQFPKHPLLNQLLHEGYPAFAQTLLQERQKTALPPYTAMAIIRAKSKTALLGEQLLQAPPALPPEVQCLGPFPALRPKKADLYHTHLVWISTQRSLLHTRLNTYLKTLNHHPLAKKVRWSVDVDPLEF